MQDQPIVKVEQSKVPPQFAGTEWTPWEVCYNVFETQNTLRPCIGDQLHEADVQRLIEDGIKVIVRGAR